MGLRRKGREIALQTMYALEYSEVNESQNNEILEDKLTEITNSKDNELDSKIIVFARELLVNTIANLTVIDKKIEEHSTNWSKNKIAVIDLIILRIAIYELLFTTTPPAIIMNEAIEIAKRYSSDSSGKFVNGILNSVAAEIGIKL